MDNNVTICVCTFRRSALFDALASFQHLVDADRYNVSVIVVDNDEADQIRPKVTKFAAEYSLPLRYVHAPSRNISIARNAALDAVETRWLLFIDDDEIADPEWLSKIIACRENNDVVIGQCVATYDQTLPSWLARCDFHSNRITGSVENAYTSNALLDMMFIRKHGIRFRLELGRTGGEDTIFFRQISKAGGRIEYCAEAVVFEKVPLARASMKWVKTRMYRAGQTHGLVTSEFDHQAYRTLLFSAGTKAIFSLAMSLLTLPGTDKSRKWLARAYLHAGAVHYRIRPTILEEYGG